MPNLYLTAGHPHSPTHPYAVVLKEDAYRYQHAAEDRLTAAEKVCEAAEAIERHKEAGFGDEGPAWVRQLAILQRHHDDALIDWRRTKEQ